MFYYPPTGQYIQLNTPFTINGVQYPANWLNLSTPEEKSELGLEEVVYLNTPADSRYYWVSETLSGAEITYINTPKDLQDGANGATGLISSCTQQVNSTAYTLLLPTDWMVIRKYERDVNIPEDVATLRASIVDECTRLRTEIENVTDVESLISVMNSQNWPTDKVV